MLKDKVIIVTGAGSGMGRAVAIELAREGAAVVVNALGVSLTGDHDGKSSAHTMVAKIEAADRRAMTNADSVADWDGAQRMVAAAVECYGRIDAVVTAPVSCATRSSTRWSQLSLSRCSRSTCSAPST